VGTFINCSQIIQWLTMAYSIYAYFDPSLLEANITFWDNYFNEHPWFKEPLEGKLFVFVKPRFENGDERFINFMNGVRLANHYLIRLDSDFYSNPSPDQVKAKFLEHGFDEFIPILQFE